MSRAICLALVAIGTEKSLESVARAMLQGDEELRRAAAEAMANDPLEGHSMLKEGATVADILLRRAVVHGLARVEQPWAVETLQHMQVEDDQWAVRNLANQYLEQMTRIDPHVPRKLAAFRIAMVDRVRRQARHGDSAWRSSDRCIAKCF